MTEAPDYRGHYYYFLKILVTRGDICNSREVNSASFTVGEGGEGIVELTSLFCKVFISFEYAYVYMAPHYVDKKYRC